MLRLHRWETSSYQQSRIEFFEKAKNSKHDITNDSIRRNARARAALRAHNVSLPVLISISNLSYLWFTPVFTPELKQNVCCVCLRSGVVQYRGGLMCENYCSLVTYRFIVNIFIMFPPPLLLRKLSLLNLWWVKSLELFFLESRHFRFFLIWDFVKLGYCTCFVTVIFQMSSTLISVIRIMFPFILLNFQESFCC